MNRGLIGAVALAAFLVAGRANAQVGDTGGASPESADATEAPANGANGPNDADDAAAREHFEAGRNYFERARYEDAAREWREAYELSHRPALLLNVARALEAARQPRAAVEALNEWLEVAAEEESRSNVIARRDRLAREADELEAEADSMTETPTETPEEPPPASPLRLIGGVTLGVGGAMLATALVTGLVSHSKYGDLEDACADDGACPPDRQGDIDRGRALGRASTALTFGGAAVGAVGLLLFLLGRPADDADDPSETTVSVRPGPGSVGAELEVTF